MNVISTVDQEASEDVFFGQAVIIWARWFLIAAGAVLIIWRFNNQDELILGTIPIILLMFMNFYLHGRYLMEKPVGVPLIVLTSLMDLVIITLLVFFWPEQGDETSLDNQFFIFYYIMVLAFGIVLPRRIEIAYTVAAIVLYAAAMLLLGDIFTNLNDAISESEEIQINLKTMVFRLIVMGAMGGLGNYYWRVQRRRRRAALADGSQG